MLNPAYLTILAVLPVTGVLDTGFSFGFLTYCVIAGRHIPLEF